MRLTIALGLLLLPAAAFAQVAPGPRTPIPVQKCERIATGFTCSPIEDGTGFAASNGFHRVAPPGAAVIGRQARATQIDRVPSMTR
jgi:hypothetical protein